MVLFKELIAICLGCERQKKTVDQQTVMNCTEQIWKEYHAELHGFIRSRVADRAIADDILQEIEDGKFGR
jgi:ABC-type uncharacterized transport system YnjBCD substrate-binding protein